MQDRHVKAVDDVLEVLQPVAGNDCRPATAETRVVGLEELAEPELLQHVDARQHGLGLRRTEICEDEPIALGHRIPRLAHVAAQLAALGLARLIQAAPVGRELPAVIAAANTVVFDSAVVKRGAAVHAARVHEAGTAAAVTEQDQVFAEHAHLARRRAGVGGEADRVPVATQQLAHRGARADLGQRRIVRGGGEPVSGAFVGLDITHCGFAPEALM